MVNGEMEKRVLLRSAGGVTSLKYGQCIQLGE